MELQAIAIARQKKINKFNKEKKNYMRKLEKEQFKQVMDARKNFDTVNDTFDSDDSFAEERAMQKFTMERKNLKQ